TLDIDPMTLIEADEFGWWYSLRLPQGFALFAFFTDSDVARHLRLRDGAQWSARLRTASHTSQRIDWRHWRTPVITASPASSSYLYRAHGANWLAVGDAAMTFDPLSSQGIINAMTSGMESGRLALQALAGDQTALGVHQSNLARQYATFLEQRQA